MFVFDFQLGINVMLKWVVQFMNKLNSHQELALGESHQIFPTVLRI